MKDLVASAADADRLLRLYRVGTLAEVAAEMVEWGDGAASVDGEGRLCVSDRPPRVDLDRCVTGGELESMFVHYGVESRDVECLRRRMIFEGGWAPEDVDARDGVIYVPSRDEDGAHCPRGNQAS